MYRRNRDGIHWNPAGNRMMTNSILTHLVLITRGVEGLPGTVKQNYSLEKLKVLATTAGKTTNSKLEMLEKLAKTIMNKVSQELLDKDKTVIVIILYRGLACRRLEDRTVR